MSRDKICSKALREFEEVKDGEKLGHCKRGGGPVRGGWGHGRVRRGSLQGQKKNFGLYSRSSWKSLKGSKQGNDRLYLCLNPLGSILGWLMFWRGPSRCGKPDRSNCSAEGERSWWLALQWVSSSFLLSNPNLHLCLQLFLLGLQRRVNSTSIWQPFK